MGFRIIKESNNNVQDIINFPPSFSVNYNDFLDMIPEDGLKNSIMLMEYLDSYEYSIDCLSYKNGESIVAIPRKKINKYNRYLENNTKLIEFAKKISKIYKIPYTYNIQVIYKNEEPYLLEINPRMSGGIHYSCLSGINLPYEAINILRYKKTKISNLDLKLDILVGNVDKPIICK